MKTIVDIERPWSTAAFGDSADTSPLELSSLKDHLCVCRGTHRRLLALNCAAESMRGFVVSRLITSILLVVLLIAMARLVL